MKDNIQREVLVIFPGGFHPFHPGHKSVYDWTIKKFGKCLITTTNSTKERPFTFEQKLKLAEVSGIPTTDFILVEHQYSPDEILKKIDNKEITETTTHTIFIVSEKDKDRFDGQKYFIPYDETLDIQASDLTIESSYVCVAPTFKFEILEKEYEDASDIRELYRTSSDSNRIKIINDLYHTNETDSIKEIFDSVIGRKTFKEMFSNEDID